MQMIGTVRHNSIGSIVLPVKRRSKLDSWLSLSLSQSLCLSLFLPLPSISPSLTVNEHCKLCQHCLRQSALSTHSETRTGTDFRAPRPLYLTSVCYIRTKWKPCRFTCVREREREREREPKLVASAEEGSIRPPAQLLVDEKTDFS